MRMLILFAILALVMPPLLPGGSSLAADEAKDQLKKFEADMKAADEAGKVNLINEFAKSGNPGAAKAIAKFMGNRSTAVKVAAIKAVGGLKDKSSYGKLMGMIKSAAKEPKVLAAVLEAVGEYGNKGALKELTKTAKKWLPKDSDVASAAARAIGRIPIKSAVETLIDLMDLTFPSTGGQSTASVSTATRDLLAKSRPAIMEGLQTLTGWDFTDAAAWKTFWKIAGKSWKPSSSEIDMTKVKTWTDPGYGFRITRPDKSWELERGRTKGKDYERYRVWLSRSEENVLQAYVFVEAADAAGLTADQKAEQYEESYRKSYEDIKEETYFRNDCRVGKAKGVRTGWTGMDSRRNICLIDYIYVSHNGIMFIVGGWWRSGLDPKSGVEAQVKKALESFKLID